MYLVVKLETNYVLKREATSRLQYNHTCSYIVSIESSRIYRESLQVLCLEPQAGYVHIPTDL